MLSFVNSSSSADRDRKTEFRGIKAINSEELIQSVTSAFVGEAYKGRDINFFLKILQQSTHLHLLRPLSIDRIGSSLTQLIGLHFSGKTLQIESLGVAT